MALDVPSWVNLIGWIVALFVALVLYRDARVRLRALGTKLATLALAGHATRVEAPDATEAPPVAAARHEPRALHVEGDEAPPTPPATREGDGHRRTSSRPPPLVRVLGVESETAPPPVPPLAPPSRRGQ